VMLRTFGSKKTKEQKGGGNCLEFILFTILLRSSDGGGSDGPSMWNACDS